MKFSISIYSAVVAVFALTTTFQLAAQDTLNHSRHHHYKVIDMGTLGGANSYVNGYTETGFSQQDLNTQAVEVGSADTSTPDPSRPNASIQIVVRFQLEYIDISPSSTVPSLSPISHGN